MEAFGGGDVLFDAAAVRHAGSEADVAALVDTEGFADAATPAPAVAEVSVGFALLVVIIAVAAVAELLREIGWLPQPSQFRFLEASECLGW